MVDTKLNISNKPIDPAKASLKAKLTQWVSNYFSGFFYLKGDNPITEAGLWPRIQKICSEEGHCVLVKKVAKKSKDSPNVFFVANIVEIESDLLEIKKLEVSYKNEYGDEILSEDLVKPVTAVECYVIFGNTPFREPDLEGSELQLNFLNALFKAMIYDLEIFRPRLILKTRNYPTLTQKKNIRDDLDKYNVIAFASLGDGKPVEFEQWKPESRHDKLKDMWMLQFTLFKELNGIRFNPSRLTEGRAPIKEVELNEDQFEGLEMLKQQEREFGLRKCYKLLGGYDYQLWAEGKPVFKIGDRYLNEEDSEASSKNTTDNKENKNNNKDLVDESKDEENKEEL